MNASSNPRKARTPRKPVLTQATIQRAQEVIEEHRAAVADLDLFTQVAGIRPQVSVEMLGASGCVFQVSTAGFAQLLAQEVVALEREAKRLGLVLEPAPSVTLRPARAQPLTPFGTTVAAAGAAASGFPDDAPGVGVETPAAVLSAGVSA